MAVPKRSCTVSAPAEPPRGALRHRYRVALHDQIELVRGAAEQHVADRAADHVHARLVAYGAKHDLRAGSELQALEQVHAGIVPSTLGRP